MPSSFADAVKNGAVELTAKSTISGSSDVAGGKQVSQGSQGQVSRPPPKKNTSSITPAVKGTGGMSGLLKPAPRGREWVWLGNLARDTTAEMVAEHLRVSYPDSDILVFDLKSKSRKKSFKVGSSDLSAEELQSPSIWPNDLLVRPFRTLP